MKLKSELIYIFTLRVCNIVVERSKGNFIPGIEAGGQTFGWCLVEVQRALLWIQDVALCSVSQLLVQVV